MTFALTEEERRAVMDGDSDWINNRGAELYYERRYEEAAEYYHLAAAMGNIHSVSNLGYCYLYGRHTERNLSLALSYFEIAAEEGDIDAAYKLGDICGSDKWGVKDIEKSLHYYRMAASLLLGEGWESKPTDYYNYNLLRYPSLAFALGRELSSDGHMETDVEKAYFFLTYAKAGYEREIESDAAMYRKAYDGVLEYLGRPEFEQFDESYKY